MEGSTGRWLAGLTALALGVAATGFLVIWAFAYGPLA